MAQLAGTTSEIDSEASRATPWHGRHSMEDAAVQAKPPNGTWCKITDKGVHQEARCTL